MEKQCLKTAREKKCLAICLAACLMVTFLLGGCARDAQGERDKTEGKWGFKDKGGTAVEDIDFSFLAEEGNSWRDNSLDDWSGIVNKHVEMEELEGVNVYALGLSATANRGIGYGYAVLSENGAVYIRHPGVDSRLEDTLIEGASAMGDPISVRLNERDLHIGGIVEGKGYLAATIQPVEDENLICFYKLDDNLRQVEELHVENSYGSFVGQVKGDGKGNIHAILRTEDGKRRYVIFSSKGESLFDRILTDDNAGSLCSLGNGRVGLRHEALKQFTLDYQFLEADQVTGELRTIAHFESTNGQDVIMKNEREFICYGSKGISHYDAAKNEETLLYKWTNHGICPEGSFGMELRKDGSLEILYLDTEGLNYLLLAPTENKEEVKTLTIAVDPKNRGIFEGAVTYFSKRHPEYTIILKDDYDPTSLLTQLGAGQGPIIIDTALTGFEDLEKLWQPLDGFLEKSGIMEELIPQALEFGRIGDRTYGLVTSFYIQTLLMKDDGIKDWDYDGFLNYVDEFQGDTVFSCNYLTFMGRASNYQQLFFDFLQNGLYDNYYVNLEDEKLVFGTEQFERVLRLSQKAKKGSYSSSTGVELTKGEVSCEICDIINIYGLAQLRNRVEEKGVHVIGRPTLDGGRNMIVGGAPVVIRSTCTEEEKKVAYTFLLYMLTKEVQGSPIKASNGSINKYGFPIRKDVLEKRFQEHDEAAAIDSIQDQFGKVSDEESVKLQIEATEQYKIIGQKDRAFFWELLQKAEVQKEFPPALENVYLEELGE